MTVAVGTELGASAGLGASGGLGTGGTFGAGGASGTGTAAGVALGAGTGVGAGASSGNDAGAEFSAVFERAASNAVPDEVAPTTLSKDSTPVGLNAAAGSEALGTGKESFETNWQSMLRAWGVQADAGETMEGTPGELSEEGAAIENSGGPSAGSMRNAPGFADPGNARSASGAGARKGSTASTAVPAGNTARANQSQPSANIPAAAANKASAAAWSGTKATGSAAGSASSAKSEKKAAGTQDTGALKQTDQPANGAAGLSVDAYVAQAALQGQANLPVIFMANAATPGVGEDVIGRADKRATSSIGDQTENRAEGRAVIAEPSAQGTPVPAIGAKGAPSTAPAVAATNTDATPRASGEIPIHAAQQASTGFHATNSGATTKLRLEDREQDGGQEEFGAPSQSSLTAALIAPGGASNANGASILETNSGVEGHKSTTVGEFPAHRGTGATNETATGSAASTASADRETVETGNGNPQALAQTAHESAGGGANTASQQDLVHVALAQNPGTETSAMIRDPAGAHGAASSPATIGGSTIGPVATPEETFAALDAGNTVGAPSWVHAGGHQAEAGFEDPALGWVSVRADMNAGSVHAAVVPGTAEAAQELSGHLAGLNAYLSEQHTLVATVSMAAPGNGGVPIGPDQGTGHGAGQGMGQGMQQSANHGEQNPAPAAWQVESRTGTSVSTTDSSAPASGFDQAAYVRDGRGGHISVMA